MGEIIVKEVPVLTESQIEEAKKAIKEALKGSKRI
jgi:hypothetical protein